MRLFKCGSIGKSVFSGQKSCLLDPCIGFSPSLACLTWSVKGLVGPEYRLLPPRSRNSALFCGQIARLTLASCLAPVTGYLSPGDKSYHPSPLLEKHIKAWAFPWMGRLQHRGVRRRVVTGLESYHLVPNPQCPPVVPDSCGPCGNSDSQYGCL